MVVFSILFVMLFLVFLFRWTRCCLSRFFWFVSNIPQPDWDRGSWLENILREYFSHAFENIFGQFLRCASWHDRWWKIFFYRFFLIAPGNELFLLRVVSQQICSETFGQTCRLRTRLCFACFRLRVRLALHRLGSNISTCLRRVWSGIRRYKLFRIHLPKVKFLVWTFFKTSNRFRITIHVHGTWNFPRHPHAMHDTSSMLNRERLIKSFF